VSKKSTRWQENEHFISLNRILFLLPLAAAWSEKENDRGSGCLSRLCGLNRKGALPLHTSPEQSIGFFDGLQNCFIFFSARFNPRK
jgi:hypothetical protein